jgi:hypothetical protein
VKEAAVRMIAFAIGLSITACVPGAHRQDAPGKRLLDPWQPVAPERSGVGFVGAEAPGAVAARERTGPDGVRIVELVLANHTLDFGENKLLVVARPGPDVGPLSIDQELTAFDLDQTVVQANFDILLRGARRVSEPRPGRNRYGTYHYVAAEYPGSSRCVYAWQHVDSTGSSSGRTVTDASVQFRFCDPHKTPDQLIEVFDGIDLAL